MSASLTSPQVRSGPFCVDGSAGGSWGFHAHTRCYVWLDFENLGNSGSFCTVELLD